MKTAHTPTPWNLSANGNINYADRIIVHGTHINGHDIRNPAYANPKQLLAQDDGGEANAAFIVKAVNCHDGLVRALEDALEAVEYQLKSLVSEHRMYPNGDIQQGDIDEADELLIKVNVALAKAKGE